MIDGEMDKTREKVKKDYENNLDAAEYVKVRNRHSSSTHLLRFKL